MKILLVNPKNRLREMPPLGLCYLAAVLKDHDVRIYDPAPYEIKNLEVYGRAILFKAEQYYSHFKNYLEKFQPQMVGFSCMTPQMPIALEMAEIVKQYNKGIVTIFGGVHPSSEPLETLKNRCVDFIVLGEGEDTIVELVDAIDKNKDVKKVKGIGYKNKVNPLRPLIENLDEILFPARELLPMKWYTKRSTIMRTHWLKTTTMMTSRGCPYNCVYCASKKVWGRSFRAHSPKRTVDEMQHLLETYKLEAIDLEDDTFAVDNKRAIDICKEIKNRNLDFLWSSQLRVNTINEELIKEMSEAGCVRIGFGVESGSQRILNVLRKGITVQQVKDAFRLCNKYNIKTVANFMIGNPEETKEDIELTKRLAKEINADETAFYITTPYPGTELYSLALEKGWFKKPESLAAYNQVLEVDQEPVMKINFTVEELKEIIFGLESEFTKKEAFNYLKQPKFLRDAFLINVLHPKIPFKIIKEILTTRNLDVALREFEKVARVRRFP